MPFGIGITEIVILAGVLLLLFGTKGAPAAARRLGTGMRDVKGAVGGLDPRPLLDPRQGPAEAVGTRALGAAKPEPAATPLAAAASRDDLPPG